MLFLILIWNLTGLRADAENRNFVPEAALQEASVSDGNETDHSFVGEVSEGNSGAGNVSPGTAVPKPEIIDQLRIDGKTLYAGMDNTYEQGYLPRTANGTVSLVIPLIGQTYDGKAAGILDLGKASDSPFVFGNYSRTVYAEQDSYVFCFEIPLAENRKNGSYPVTLTVDYLDTSGNRAQQTFTVYITVADGIDPSQPIETQKEAAEAPKLIIGDCRTEPVKTVGGENFTVTVTVENIGSIKARSVLLTYGSDENGILPLQTNNQIHLSDIAGGRSASVTLEFSTAGDILSGTHSFYIGLDYCDLYGGTYTEQRIFRIQVIQPASLFLEPLSVPEQMICGETVKLPVAVFNTGKSPLHNVIFSLSVPGLLPLNGVFFGNIPPGESGAGEVEIYAGTLSVTGGQEQNFGASFGSYSITYTDEEGEEHVIKENISTQILEPPAGTEEETGKQDMAAQWWLSILIALAVIAVLVSVIIVNRFSRMIRMK